MYKQEFDINRLMLIMYTFDLQTCSLLFPYCQYYYFQFYCALSCCMHSTNTVPSMVYVSWYMDFRVVFRSHHFILFEISSPGLILLHLFMLSACCNEFRMNTLQGGINSWIVPLNVRVISNCFASLACFSLFRIITLLILGSWNPLRVPDSIRHVGQDRYQYLHFDQRLLHVHFLTDHTPLLQGCIRMDLLQLRDISDHADSRIWNDISFQNLPSCILTLYLCKRKRLLCLFLSDLLPVHSFSEHVYQQYHKRAIQKVCPVPTLPFFSSIHVFL